jgi:preprotein translocase subunit YajC
MNILAQQPGGGASGSLVMLLVIGVLFYFLLIRPQQKRAREQRNLVNSLGVGDLVVTIGGFHGTITSVDESTVRLELNPTNVVTVSKQAIARRTVDANTSTDAEEVSEE